MRIWGLAPPQSEKNLEKISPLLKSEFPSKPLLVINNYWQIIVVWTVCKRGRGYHNLQGYPCRILQKRLYNNTWVSFFIHLHSKAYEGGAKGAHPTPESVKCMVSKGFLGSTDAEPPPSINKFLSTPLIIFFLEFKHFSWIKIQMKTIHVLLDIRCYKSLFPWGEGNPKK